MKYIDKYNSTIINILFFIFPLSLILGNFFINLNIFFLCIYPLIFYKKKIISFKINFFDKIILIFFSYTFLVLVINFAESYLYDQIFSKFVLNKTFFYFRYLFLYLILRVLISQKILKLNLFSLACAVCVTFVSLDIFFQFFSGKNIFGIEPVNRHYSGVFGSELIAGGYIQKFALFSLFLPFILKKPFFHRTMIQFFLFTVFSFAIILSGNRMPFILFFVSFFVILFLNKELRKYIFYIFIIFILSVMLTYKMSKEFEMNSGNFYKETKNLFKTFFVQDLTGAPAEVWSKPYVTEFHCFKHIWKKNPIFGGGVRYYRTTENCNSHPHNYYFEILTDLGIIGLSIILFFVFMLLRKIFVKKNTLFRINLNALDSKIIPFFIIFFIEFFPLRSSGSFFTTGNSAVTFIILAILVSLVSRNKLYNY
jgi:O-antigen ligase